MIFQAPTALTEKEFEVMMWMRLQSLSDIDAQKYRYDIRVSADPASPDFSFSLKEEAFYIVGLHPNSCRKARQFAYPALVFNPHAQFEMLKETTKYQSMQRVIRKRDLKFSGTVNPMLEDHGQSSEAKQYSGTNYAGNFKCPLKIKHAT